MACVAVMACIALYNGWYTCSWLVLQCTMAGVSAMAYIRRVLAQCKGTIAA